MKLCMIEGFGFDVVDHDPDQLLTTKPNDFAPLFNGRELYFTPEDSPTDLVKVVPALTSVSLASFVDTNHLPGFTGKVYYGFKTALHDEYKTAAIEKLIRPLETALEQSGKLYGGATVGNLSNEMRRIRSTNPDKANVYETAIRTAIKVHAAFKVKTRQQDFGLNSAIKLILLKTGANYARNAAFSFAKRLKHPESGDAPIISKFLDLCEQQLEKLPGTAIAYDYVIAPKSSANFNRELANRIAKTRGSEFLEIGKRLGKDVTVNLDQLVDRARRETPKRKESTPEGDRWYGKMKDDEGDMAKWEYATEDDFVNDWSQNEYNKLANGVVARLPKSKEAAIKNQNYLDKRRYVKIYSDQNAAPAAGKSVLLIDDNIVGGGTIELVHEILVGLQPPPKRVDIFVPLYLPNGH